MLALNPQERPRRSPQHFGLADLPPFAVGDESRFLVALEVGRLANEAAAGGCLPLDPLCEAPTVVF